MEMWIVWVAIAMLALLVEIFTLGLAVICFSAAALVAALVAFCGAGWMWQVAIFSIFSVAMLLFLRPVALRLLSREEGGSAVETNVNALVGRRATVTEKICDGEGRAVIDGDDWKVELDDDMSDVEVGEKVEVVEVRSVILVVKKL